MRELVAEVIVPAFDNAWLSTLEDQARLPPGSLPEGSTLAFTTDSYVVSPLVFPGGDIGTLAVCGTVNDLAVGGAHPRWLSCALILEEGTSIDLLRQVLASMAAKAREAKVAIVTGDTKVVQRGACDGLFINTSGIGAIPAGRHTGPETVRSGDRLIVNGTLGDHGIAILAARNELALEIPVLSDCGPLNELVEIMFEAAPHGGIHWLRDCTRGGLATIANEFATEGKLNLNLFESALPVNDAVRGACEILGLDPLYLANEGKLAAIVSAQAAGPVLAAMHAHPLGQAAAIVGEVLKPDTRNRAPVTLRSVFGGERVVDLLHGDQLPRIC
ncbi:carbamoyl phosphate phosphatase, hydrogenase 3 maturation protein [Paraburkholderia ribeironis]|uniref:Carbamoyl phosphate phosphatase, hydrogenase 3 maturation protein n=2 Tax=Paraburkholderia ribeironis TaxID=1247936 RepID=A0A1N7RSW7_9BURK|nr:carbamoyl phosphate phosphatase, hydrogenase 3 maturation protein [Paraburkholderia ribeironis]